MEKDEYIVFFINNISWFNTTTIDDFAELSIINIEDYDKEEYRKKIFNILQELFHYSEAYINANDIIDLECEIKDKNEIARMNKMLKVSEMCFSYMKMLVDEACPHPIVKAFEHLNTAKICYDEFFDAMYEMQCYLTDKEVKSNIGKYDYKINETIDKIKEKQLQNLGLISNELDNKTLIQIVSNILFHERYMKVMEIDETKDGILVFGELPYNIRPKTLNTNNLLLHKPKKTDNSIMFSHIESMKPILFFNLIAYLAKIKQEIGENEIETEDVNYSKYDYFPEDEDADEDEDDYYEEEDEDVEGFTIGSYIDYINNNYYMYKESQCKFMKSSSELTKIYTKRQDM